jgi:hypothetical protein
LRASYFYPDGVKARSNSVLMEWARRKGQGKGASRKSPNGGSCKGTLECQSRRFAQQAGGKVGFSQSARASRQAPNRRQVPRRHIASLGGVRNGNALPTSAYTGPAGSLPSCTCVAAGKCIICGRHRGSGPRSGEANVSQSRNIVKN